MNTFCIKYRIALATTALLITTALFSQSAITIIPEPASIIPNKGTFIIKPTSCIYASADTLQHIARYLSEKLNASTGFPLLVKTSHKHESKAYSIYLATSPDSTLGLEGYRLVVSPEKIEITGYRPAGIFYGIQSLLQLFPKEISSNAIVPNITWAAPAVTITDSPRFVWRGLMLDVVRHFFTKEEIKDFIDNMVRYKYNLLHLHLTDDQGWRIQIDCLPRLTEVGAWRPKREGKWGISSAPDSTEPKDYGGFYTHDDVRELVKYAADRFVNILPEIDVPGHSMAALASYPALSCTAESYQVNIGNKFIEWHGGGKFTLLTDNNLCPANEQVYSFLDKVFTDVAQLFPFQYIHMGGDEAGKTFWINNDTIRTLMDSLGLKDMDAVQAFFVKRVRDIITSKGKKMMGWDEIMEGGLADDAAVMSWRGMKGGTEAAKAGHKVVMAPESHAYLDLMQGDSIIEQRLRATVRLNKVYQFDPLPDGVNPQMILGGQGNLWAERIPNMRTIQYMLWPRGFALAEDLWSPKDKKNWNNFVPKVEKELQRLQLLKVKYATSMYEPSFTAYKEAGKLKVKLESEVPVDIYYSFDESNPDEFYPKYMQPLIVPGDAVTLKIVTFRNGKQAGRQINMPVSELVKRAK